MLSKTLWARGSGGARDRGILPAEEGTPALLAEAASSSPAVAVPRSAAVERLDADCRASFAMDPTPSRSGGRRSVSAPPASYWWRRRHATFNSSAVGMWGLTSCARSLTLEELAATEPCMASHTQRVPYTRLDTKQLPQSNNSQGGSCGKSLTPLATAETEKPRNIVPTTMYVLMWWLVSSKRSRRSSRKRFHWATRNFIS
mmetsp:Transcript_92288/g.275286  ORF Transcript_92288/g.275286 Transcript_92288/m.275286 type:complete len:201 (-) Transcript_92288:190-792(-)